MRFHTVLIYVLNCEIVWIANGAFTQRCIKCRIGLVTSGVVVLNRWGMESCVCLERDCKQFWRLIYLVCLFCVILATSYCLLGVWPWKWIVKIWCGWVAGREEKILNIVCFLMIVHVYKLHGLSQFCLGLSSTPGCCKQLMYGAFVCRGAACWCLWLRERCFGTLYVLFNTWGESQYGRDSFIYLLSQIVDRLGEDKMHNCRHVRMFQLLGLCQKWCSLDWGTCYSSWINFSL